MISLLEKFERFWTTAFDNVPSNRLVYDSKYVKIIDVSGSKFEELKSHALNILANSAPRETLSHLNVGKSGWEQRLSNYLNSTDQFSVKKDVNALIKLEKQFLDLIRPFGVEQSLRGIELPVNLRAAHAKPPAGYADLPYSTDKLHCDIWAGEPLDTIHSLLYIDIDDDSTRVEFKNLTPEIAEQTFKRRGEYSVELQGFEDLPTLDIPHQPGYLIFFDNRVPHRTIRGNKVRLSLDARFRTSEPYDSNYKATDPDYKISSKYWYLPTDDNISEYSNRLQSEITALKSKGFEQHALCRQEMEANEIFGKFPKNAEY